MTDKYDKYESMDEIDKLKFLADVANMYYNLNMTQIDLLNSPLKEIQN